METGTRKGGRGSDPRCAITTEPLPPRVEKPALARFLGAVDVSALRAHVERLSEKAWRRENAARARGNLRSAHTQHIVFRFIDGDRTPLDFRSKQPTWTIWRRLLLPVMAQAAARYGFAEPCYPAALLARFGAGQLACRSADGGRCHPLTHRIHVPLRTGPRALLTVDGAGFPLETGHAWEINNLLPHGVSNRGGRDCVHLVFDVFEGAPHPRYCPICDTSSFRFQDAGRNGRTDARCGRCGSLERHRLIWLYLERTWDLRSFSGKMLDVSPAVALANGLRPLLGDRYLSAGKGPADMERMDVQDMPYADRTFDLVCCSHVLEHVGNDRKAMREIARVLKNGGHALILVPIYSGNTCEDPAITSPEDRLIHFGSPHHVRRYGLDFVAGLQGVGFDVRIVRATDVLSTHEIEKMRIRHRLRSGQPAGEEDLIFHCTKAGEQDIRNDAPDDARSPARAAG